MKQDIRSIGILLRINNWYKYFRIVFELNILCKTLNTNIIYFVMEFQSNWKINESKLL